MDGEDLIDDPIHGAYKNEYTQVPILFGSVSEEALFFVYQASMGHQVNNLEYMALLDLLFGFQNGGTIEALYPYNGETDGIIGSAIDFRYPPHHV